MPNKLCAKCGTEMDMHYVLWCPNCSVPVVTKVDVVDFFQAARYIAQQEGYLWKNVDRKVDWVHNVLVDLEIQGNDSYKLWTAIEPDELEACNELSIQFDQGLRKYFGLKDDCSILLNISW